MRDFRLRTYAQLLEVLAESGYAFLTFEQYCTIRQGTSSTKVLPERYVVMRHDVDKRPWYAVRMAEVEARHGVKASYYFRIVKESNDAECIKRIAGLGHEIGYHYEDMSLCEGDHRKGYEHFRESLEYFRQFYPVQTCCMHGAPTSKYDSRALWEKYDYHELGLIGEPYYDVDFSKVLYLTDTGRCWDGYRYSLRDKVPEHQQRWNDAGWVFHSTDDILDGLHAQSVPPALMLTTHPQRWTDSRGAWWKELIAQKIKNIVKRAMIVLRK